MKVFELAQVVHKPELFTMVVPVIENGRHFNISVTNFHVSLKVKTCSQFCKRKEVSVVSDYSKLVSVVGLQELTQSLKELIKMLHTLGGVCIVHSYHSDYNENSDDVNLNLDDLQDFKLTDYISSLLLDTLRTARENVPNLQILVPSDLAEHVAKDVVCMSSNEPCGARGCALDLVIEDGEMCTRIGKCQVDPLTVTTFEVTVVLQKEVPKWFPKLQMILRNNESKTVLKPTYKLVKRKLYRKESKIQVQESS